MAFQLRRTRCQGLGLEFRSTVLNLSTWRRSRLRQKERCPIPPTMKPLRFIDLFAGIGGFHRALSALGHECVFASELDEELQALYVKNFPSMKGKVHGDIRRHWKDVPEHDILCAGFPCQPFSKSGAQRGTRDKTRGTLFHEILNILELRKPRLVLLENVGNFARHDKGRTWSIVRESLEALGYDVYGTEHLTPIRDRDWRDVGVAPEVGARRRSKVPKSTGGHGLISPHHFGFPQHRERFFIVASLDSLPDAPFPPRQPPVETNLEALLMDEDQLDSRDLKETALAPHQLLCVTRWNQFVRALPADLEPPSFPLWSDEFGAAYPFAVRTPWATPLPSLRKTLLVKPQRGATRKEILALLPSYAREEKAAFRQWKIRFICNNRNWWLKASDFAPAGWLGSIRELPSSFRKLEWNVKGGNRNLWRHILQFRPSGLRVRRMTCSPALVAMTATQIPVIGPRRRFITRIEGLRLQGFPDRHELPHTRERAFQALGNAVHVGVVEHIARRVLSLLAQHKVSKPAARQVA